MHLFWAAYVTVDNLFLIISNLSYINVWLNRKSCSQFYLIKIKSYTFRIHKIPPQKRKEINIYKVTDNLLTTRQSKCIKMTRSVSQVFQTDSAVGQMPVSIRFWLRVCFTFVWAKSTKSSSNKATTTAPAKVHDPPLPDDIFPLARRSARRMQIHPQFSVKTQQQQVRLHLSI